MLSPAEADEGVGTGEGFSAGRAGCGGEGSRMVPNSNPHHQREAEAYRPERPPHSKKHTHWSQNIQISNYLNN